MSTKKKKNHETKSKRARLMTSKDCVKEENILRMKKKKKKWKENKLGKKRKKAEIIFCISILVFCPSKICFSLFYFCIIFFVTLFIVAKPRTAFFLENERKKIIRFFSTSFIRKVVNAKLKKFFFSLYRWYRLMKMTTTTMVMVTTKATKNIMIK